jgi:hypothetical protein
MKYRKKPVEIEAVQWTGKNKEEIEAFCDIAEFYEFCDGATLQLIIPTLEGDHYASPDDFIIRGISGEYYPCKPDIFEMTYEKAE